MPTNYEMDKYLYYIHTTVYYDGNEYTVFHVLHPPVWTDGSYKPEVETKGTYDFIYMDPHDRQK